MVRHMNSIHSDIISNTNELLRELLLLPHAIHFFVKVTIFEFLYFIDFESGLHETLRFYGN